MLERQVIAKQAGIVCRTIILLGYLLFRGLIGQVCIGPDLTMGMGVAGAHHGSAIFEDLNVVDEGEIPELAILCRPYVHHSPKLVRGHARNRQVMTRRETHHAADAGFALRDNQPILIYAAIWSIRQQGWVVIVKHERVVVMRIADSGGTQVSRTHVAGGIVSR